MIEVGKRVRALRNIVNVGEEGNPDQKDIREDDFLYSLKDGLGTIEHLESYHEEICPTVRFDQTGCATIVKWNEIEEV